LLLLFLCYAIFTTSDEQNNKESKAEGEEEKEKETGEIPTRTINQSQAKPCH
jgi:hypothetical protein